MIGLSIVMDATEDPLPGLPEREDGHGELTAIGGIPNGTGAGLAAVALVVTLPDGKTVVAQTTLALLHGATRALAARYPDPRP